MTGKKQRSKNAKTTDKTTIKEKLAKKSFKSEKMSKDMDKKFAKRIVVPTTSASIIFTQITVGAICILLVNQPE